MNKFLVTAVFGMSISLVSQPALAQSTPAQSTPAQASGTDAQSNAASPAGQKTIKDPTEFNAFMTATTTADPNQKAAALESFIQQYPSSVVKEDALAAEMSAYQVAGNLPKTAEVAGRLLQVNPNHVSALAVLVYTKRQSPQGLNEAGQLAVRGLASLQTWAKPDGMSDADFEKQKAGLAAIFDGAAGAAALQNKDFPSAQKYLRDSVVRNPNNADDTYNLAAAYLTPKPITDEAHLNGLWFLARALNLVTGNAVPEKQIGDYARKIYKNFHGSEQGWDQVLAQAKTSVLPPPGFTIEKFIPPSPAQVAADMVAKGKFTDMGFGEWIFILTSGNQQAADAIWEKIKGKMLKFQGRVTETGATDLGLSVTADGIEAKKTEVRVEMKPALRTPPAAGTDYQLEAVPVSYTPSPFIMKMDQGTPIGTNAKKGTPAKKKTTTKKRSQ